MSFWFFLTVVVLGNLALKAYKMRIHENRKESLARLTVLEREQKTMREKIQILDEAVFFGDFDLKRQFQKLEKEMSSAKNYSS